MKEKKTKKAMEGIQTTEFHQVLTTAYGPSHAMYTRAHSGRSSGLGLVDDQTRIKQMWDH